MLLKKKNMLVLTYKALLGQAPVYIRDMSQQVSEARSGSAGRAANRLKD